MITKASRLFGIRNIRTSATVIKQARVMRKVAPPLPGVGASSRRRNSRSAFGLTDNQHALEKQSDEAEGDETHDTQPGNVEDHPGEQRGAQADRDADHAENGAEQGDESRGAGSR